MSGLTRNYSIMYAFEPDNLNLGVGGKDYSSQSSFYVQTSLLYTNEARQRMLKVHNYSVKTSRDTGEIYGAIDYPTLVTAIVRKKLPSFISSVPLIDIQLEMINEFKKLFKGIAGQTSADFQSHILPYLALGFLGVLKSSVFQAHYINNCELTSQKQQRRLGHQRPSAPEQSVSRHHLQVDQPLPVQPERPRDWIGDHGRVREFRVPADASADARLAG